MNCKSENESGVLIKIKNTIFKNKRWIIVAILIFVFILIAENVLGKEKIILDSVVYQFLLEHRNNFLTFLFKTITQLGSAIYLIIITILCIIFVKNKKYKVTIPLNLVLIALINLIMKNIFVRPRPDEFRVIDETGYSFPSGHSMASMAFYGYLIYIIHKNVKNKILKYILCTILSILILLIGLSRIYLGVHYTSDVIAGLCFSMTYLIFMVSIGVYR